MYCKRYGGRGEGLVCTGKRWGGRGEGSVCTGRGGEDGVKVQYVLEEVRRRG